MNKFIISIALILVNCIGMQAQSHIQLANHTNLAFDFEVTLLQGSATQLAQSQTKVIPWENANHHNLGDQVVSILLGILFNEPIKHAERNYILKCERNKGNRPDINYTAEIDVLNDGNLVFTITIDQTADGHFYYNLKDIDGNLDSPNGYELIDNSGNQPHEASLTFQINSKAYKIVYGVYDRPQDGTDNVIYAISELNPDNERQITPDAIDLEDASILNVYTFNPGLLKPLDFNDQEENERAEVFHLGIPDNMDIIILQEMFEENLVTKILDSLSTKYPYHTGRHNAPLLPGLSKGGGVRILSKHPILEEADISFSENGSVPTDIFSLFANKGVKYAKINKEGQIIHVFGTHTSIRPGDLNIMGRFMSEFDIPKEDIVIMGGDMNVDLYEQKDNAYQIMLDTFHAIEPTYETLTYDSPYRGTTWGLSHYNSGDYNVRQVLDYILASKNHKMPLELFNLTQVARVNNTNKKFWGVFDLGDHNPVYAKMKFPTLTTQNTDTLACPGDQIEMDVSAGFEYDSLVWYHDTVRLGQLGELYTINSFTEEQYGNYYCHTFYHYMPDTIINGITDTVLMNGPYITPKMAVASINTHFRFMPDPDRCAVILSNNNTLTKSELSVFPNPANNYISIENTFLNDTEYLFEIRSVNGQIIKQEIVYDLKNIELPDLEKAAYFISIQNSNGDKWNEMIIIN